MYYKKDTLWSTGGKIVRWNGWNTSIHPIHLSIAQMAIESLINASTDIPYPND